MPYYNNTLPSLPAAPLSVASAANTLLVLPPVPSPACTTTPCIACLAVLCLLRCTLLPKLACSCKAYPLALAVASLLAVQLGIIAAADSLILLVLAASCLT
jgi:hypothetical protein